MMRLGWQPVIRCRSCRSRPVLIAAAISTVKCNVEQGADHANTESEQGLSALGCSGDQAIDGEEPSWVDAQRSDQLEPNGQGTPPA